MKMASGERTIVIQPGSRYLKIGLAKDAFPKLVPHVIARKSQSMFPLEPPSWSLPAEDLKAALQERNKQAKKKSPPNIYTSISSYNASTEPQQIPLHNDSYAFEWTTTKGKPFICGKDALRINPEEGYQLTWPLKRGTIDRLRYSSYRDASEDLELIWRDAIEHHLQVNRSNFGDYAFMLVVPATITGWEVKTYSEIVLNGLRGKAISFISEPVASTFCAGISSGCVVDMGSQTTTICCVEEGSVLADSLLQLNFGGDDLTDLFHQILRHHNFPYKPSSGNLSDSIDFDLLNDLRERLCTLDEEDISSQIYEFFVRRPSKTTLHFNFKILEERILPLEVFLHAEPESNWLFKFEEARRSASTESFWTGSYDLTGEITNVQATQSQANGEVEIDMEDDPMTQPKIEAEETTQVNTQETFECKWTRCKSDPFQTLIGIINHIKEDHLSAALCCWGECKKDISTLSEPSKIGHLVDHLNERFMSERMSAEPQPSHLEPSLRALANLNLIEAILKSLQVSPKNASSVLLVGGLSKTPFLSDHLFSCLASSVPSISDIGEPIAVDFVLGGHSSNLANRDQTLDPTFFGWKGGAVASKLEATQEACWMTQKDWDDWGIRALRERLPFTLA